MKKNLSLFWFLLLCAQLLAASDQQNNYRVGARLEWDVDRGTESVAWLESRAEKFRTSNAAEFEERLSLRQKSAKDSGRDGLFTAVLDERFTRYFWIFLPKAIGPASNSPARINAVLVEAIYAHLPQGLTIYSRTILLDQPSTAAWAGDYSSTNDLVELPFRSETRSFSVFLPGDLYESDLATRETALKSRGSH